MRTIRRSGEHEIEVKKSRFRCALARVTSEDEAREFIHARRRQHHDARHHCSAFVLGDGASTQRSSDDGEPAGTAGVPMLEVLRRNELTNTVAVVTRWFGGVKLGAGGLVRAYGTVVADALDHVGLAQRRPMRIVHITTGHLTAGKWENDLRAAGHRVADVEYGDAVRIEVHVPDDSVADFEAWLAESTGGDAVTTRGALIHVVVDL